MGASASPKAARNELILDNAGEMSCDDLSRLVYQRTGEWVSSNSVNIVIVRARNAGDPRVPRRKSRRGTKGNSPFNKQTFAREGKVLPFRGPQPPEEKEGKLLHEQMEADGLPDTARLLIKTKNRHCRFPLRGSGISLIVCGDRITDEKSSYCSECRKRAYVGLP